MIHISTIDELVEFFGGDTALAELLGISQPAVAHWKMRKRIASGWHLRLLAEVRARGATVDPEVFGMSADEGEGLFERPLSTGSQEIEPATAA